MGKKGVVSRSANGKESNSKADDDGGVRTPLPSPMSPLEWAITNHRWFFCLVFLLPMSVLFDLYTQIIWLYGRYTRKAAPEKHRQRVKFVQDQVKAWVAEGGKRTMCTGRPGWKAMSLRVGKYKSTSCNVYLNDVCDVLEIDEVNRWVRVEPMVTMGQLTAAINPLGWTIPVVPELDDLTIGGLISGVGVESSSHRHGLFQHICLEFEVVLADGSVVECSREKHPELFANIPWSHGTLGFLVGAKIRLVPCKPYVHLRYEPFSNKEAALARFESMSRMEGGGGYDFVEALAFSPNDFVVMLGRMATEKDVIKSQINRIGRFWKPWFYTHARSFLGKGAREEYVPLREYYHRHTRSIFWEVEEIIPFGNKPWFRYLLGWTMPPKISLLKLTQTETLRQLYEKHHVAQDMLVPIRDLGDSLSVFDKEFFVYPLWLCPMKVPQDPKQKGLLRALPDGDEMFVDVGAYGHPMVPCYQARESCRRVEAFVLEKGGFQMLYADTYLTRDEFREMFDHTTYDKLRSELALTKQGFTEIYDKICKANRI